MIDLKLDIHGDLEISKSGDIATTNSVIQAVRIRLQWFSEEWRLGPSFGIPYFEDVLVKNPDETLIRSLVSEAILDVEGVSDVQEINLSLDKETRDMIISVTFIVDEETFREEAKIKWSNMD